MLGDDGTENIIRDDETTEDAIGVDAENSKVKGIMNVDEVAGIFVCGNSDLKTVNDKDGWDDQDRKQLKD